MDYLETSKQLYIKKTDIEYSIGLVKQGNQFIPKQSTPLLQAINTAILAVEKQLSVKVEYSQVTNKPYCPKCTYDLLYDEQGWCSHCGQSLEW